MKLKYYIIILLLSFYTANIFACKCLEVSVADNLASSDIVFKGKVISQVITNNFDSLNISLGDTNVDIDFSAIPVSAVTIEIDTLYKGLGCHILTIITPASSASCGVYFSTGEEYMIYASMQMRQPYQVKDNCNCRNIFWTHSCTRTKIWTAEEEQAIFIELEKNNGEN